MRGFSDDEREQIREQLIQTGRELLLTYGPEKTNVTDITEPVGIAKSTFYRFFDSKADLYLVIMEREMNEYVENVRSELEGVEDPREGLERFFWCYVEFAEGNPLIQQILIQTDNYQDVFRNISSDKLAAVEREEVARFLPLIEDLKARSSGPLADINMLTLFGIMGGSIGLMVLHRDEFEEYDDEFGEYDEGYYKHVQEALISTLARGLAVE
jgi:AcrR family transcriptional regulator